MKLLPNIGKRSYGEILLNKIMIWCNKKTSAIFFCNRS